LPSPSTGSRRHWRGLLLNGALVFACCFALLPIATTLLESFKGERDVTRRPPILFPCDTRTSSFDLSACRWTVEGYDRALAPKPAAHALFGFILTSRMFTTFLPNTLLYATVTSALVVLLAGMSGYAFSRYRFRGRQALLIGILAIMGVPLLTNLVALYQAGATLRKSALPIYNDRVFIMVVYTGFFLPLSVWIAKGFMDAIPRELEEAALIDGCSPVGTLMRITMPLALPGLTSVFLLSFVNVWNEFIAGYLLISKIELRPLMYGLYAFLGQNIVNVHVVAAICVLIALPMVLLFLFARRVFFRAMVEGAIKG